MPHSQFVYRCFEITITTDFWPAFVTVFQCLGLVSGCLLILFPIHLLFCREEPFWFKSPDISLSSRMNFGFRTRISWNYILFSKFRLSQFQLWILLKNKSLSNIQKFKDVIRYSKWVFLEIHDRGTKK